VAQRKLIITLHANGPSKSVNPHLAYSPKEIADQAVECWRAGASVIHYHACDPVTGAPSADTALFAETERRIHGECDMITFPTLGASIAPSEGRVSHILEIAKDPATKPDCIPVDILTTNLDAYDLEKKTFTSLDRIYSNTTRTLIDIAERVSAAGVRPVPMFWNVASVRVTQKLVEMGVFKEPMFCEASVYVKGVNALIDFIPPEADWRWTVSVIGANAFSVLANTIERGGDVAIGLHDYPYPELGLPSNAELIARVADLARAMGREVATAAEAREILELR
jgi:uncharacterized protein (DUF849 family)